VTPDTATRYPGDSPCADEVVTVAVEPETLTLLMVRAEVDTTLAVPPAKVEIFCPGGLQVRSGAVVWVQIPVPLYVAVHGYDTNLKKVPFLPVLPPCLHPDLRVPVHVDVPAGMAVALTRRLLSTIPYRVTVSSLVKLRVSVTRLEGAKTPPSSSRLVPSSAERLLGT